MGRQWHVKEGERRVIGRGEGDAINDGSSLTQILQLNLGHMAGGTSTRPPLLPPPRMLCWGCECQIDFLRRYCDWTALEFVFRRADEHNKHDRRNDSGKKQARPSPTHPSIIPKLTNHKAHCTSSVSCFVHLVHIQTSVAAAEEKHKDYSMQPA